MPVPDECDTKPGYTLVFSDEFDSFNATTWNKSNPGNDLANYGTDLFCDGYNDAPQNHGNVAVFAGLLDLIVREGEILNACSHSSAEVKTFGGGRDWKIYSNSYIEARIKVPFCKSIGSGFWLYGAVAGVNGQRERFYEIDMFETGKDDKNHLGANVHYGPKYGEHETTNQKNIQVKDENGDRVTLADYFLIYGVEITDAEVKMYLNNVLYATYLFEPSTSNISKDYTSYFNHPLDFNIRMGIGGSAYDMESSVSDCTDLPAHMQVDYVRVYRKNNAETIRFTNNTQKMTLCPGQPGSNVSLDYYPGAEFEWDDTPLFKFEWNPTGIDNCNCVRWWVTIQPGTPPGIYSIPINITLPCGLTQIKYVEITVQGNTLPAPNLISMVKSGAFYIPYVLQNPGSIAYEWVIWNSWGLDPAYWDWEKVPNNPNGIYNMWATAGIQQLPYTRDVTICVRPVNSCGSGAIYCQTITIPGFHTPNQGIMVLAPPTDILVTSIPNSLNFHAAVIRSPVAEGYQWSFDEENWYYVQSYYSDTLNYFAEFEPGTPPLRIYVRAKRLDTLSYTYSEIVEFPGALPRMSPNSEPEQHIGQKSENINANDRAASKANPVEELRDSNGKFYLFNSLGQLVATDLLMHLSIPDLKENLPAGLYFLVRQTENMSDRQCHKLLISR